MSISNRLKKIAGYVEKNSNIIDIGTDHAYVPIYLISNNIISNAIAADISQGSCNKANENILQYNLQNKIKVIKSDGLKNIDTTNFDTIIIAGMGGNLISNILEDQKFKLKNIKNLILQPQSDIYKVRQKLHELDYKIIDEDFFDDMNKYYNIIISKQGKEQYINKIYYKYSKCLLKNKNIKYKIYLKNELHKLKDINLKIKDKNNLIENNNKINLLRRILSEYYM